MPSGAFYIRHLLIAVGLFFLGSSVFAQPRLAIAKVRSMIEQPEGRLDLAQLKVAIDKIVDPISDPDKVLKDIDRIVSEINSGLQVGSTSMQKLQAIRKYLFVSGPWNNQQPFQYDFDDPKGMNLKTKTLARYLATKKGNCVSMPMLLIVIADRMGLDVSATTAPEHLLVKFTETETGQSYNVEATSGGGFSRDKWYQDQMHISEQALSRGAYLQKLTRKETAAVMIGLLAEFYYAQGEFEKAIEISELILKYYPKSVFSMLKIGGSYSQLFKVRFMKKYTRDSDVPPSEKDLFNLYVDQNRRYFEMAESLGWREPPKS